MVLILIISLFISSSVSVRYVSLYSSFSSIVYSECLIDISLMSSPRFVIESKRKTKRGLVYEKLLFPKHTSGETVTAPGTVSRMEFSFDKVTLVKGQVFRIYLYEDGGPRNFVLSFGVRDVN